MTRQENTQHSDSWKQGDRKESSDSTSTRQLVRAATPRTEFQNMKYANHQYMTKVFHFLQKKFGFTAGFSTFALEALKTNVLISGMFMSSSMKAAVHLEPNYLANLDNDKNTNVEEIQSLVNTTQKLILEHSEEILKVHTIESASPSWPRSTLSNDRVIRWTKAKVRVYPDSLLYLGKMWASREAIKRWEGQVGELKMCASHIESQGIDGEPTELEWNILPGFSSLQILQKIQNDLREQNIEPEKFTDTIIFMSMFNDIDWTRKGNDEIRISNLEKVKEYAKRFSQGHWTILGPANEKKWYGTLLCTPEGKWDSTATQMVERFKDTGHPVFKSVSALNRGILKKKFYRDTVHLHGGCFKHRALVPNHSFSKSAQYLWSTFELV